jgi:hypothetical protein
MDEFVFNLLLLLAEALLEFLIELAGEATFSQLLLQPEKCLLFRGRLTQCSPRLGM